MKRVSAVSVNKISVNCEANDSQDIQCGGPQMLGYDFYVDADENVKDLEKFIKKCIKKNNQPFSSMQVTQEIIEEKDTDKLWSRGCIEQEIQKGYK